MGTFCPNTTMIYSVDEVLRNEMLDMFCGKQRSLDQCQREYPDLTEEIIRRGTAKSDVQLEFDSLIDSFVTFIDRFTAPEGE